MSLVSSLKALPPGKLKALQKALTPRTTKYFRQAPTDRQRAFLLYDGREALYGGAAGGGKSSALLMAALQYVDVPGYSALLLRRTYADLSKAGALMDRAREWLSGTDARWNEQKKEWRFPSGAVLAFGHMENEKDKFNYQGSEWQFVGFDELTHFTQTQYTYLFSRLRRLKGSPVPLRVRAGSNPGGVGHEWVFERFFTNRGKRVFVKSLLEDNPHLDREEYEESLKELDPITRLQLRMGDWTVRQKGPLFQREWFRIVDEPPAGIRWVRRWDLAATEVKPGKDPDWTAGAKVGWKDGVLYIADIVRKRARPMAIEQLIQQTAELDGKDVAIRMEQEPGSSGLNTIDNYARRVLVGYDFRGERSTGDKVSYARPLSAAAEAGNVVLVRGPWNKDFLDEVEPFPTPGVHDDQVDAVSKGMVDAKEESFWVV